MPEIEYEVSSEDLIAFNLHVLHNSEHMSRQLRNSRLILALLAPALIFLGIGVFSGDVIPGAAIGIATGVVLWFALPRLLRLQIDRNVRRMAAGAALGQTGRHRLVVLDTGLQERTPSTSSTVAWSGIVRVDDTVDHAFIYFSPVQAFVIPKRGRAEEVSGFLTEVRTRLPG